MPSVHYNLDYLQQVFQGNDAMVQRILDSFEEQVPAYFEEMNRRWRSGRWQDIHPLAHKAKSSIGMLGMNGLLDHVLYIEQVSRTASSPGDIGERLEQACALLTLALDAMRRDRGSPLDAGNASADGALTDAASRRAKRRLRRA